MQKELFDKIVIETDEKVPHKIKLTYYMVTDCVREEYCDLKVYGAEIEKEEIFADGTREYDSKIIKNLFFRYSEAEKFLEKLKNGGVTPMGLVSAVSEHINEQIYRLTYEG